MANEQQIRRFLPVIRFLIAVLPLRVIRLAISLSRNQRRVPDGITCEPVSVNGIPAEWIIPAGATPERVILYLHGGGFVMGWTAQHRAMCAYLAQKSETRILAIDYRLAPEFPFPAALEDCISAYDWLLSQGYAPNHIAIGGDSAGANLTLSLLMWLRDSQRRPSLAAFLICPVIDLSDSNESILNHYDEVLHPRALRYFQRSYVGNYDPKHPGISPYYGKWNALPPILIHAGGDEVLRFDAIKAETKIAAQGMATRLQVYPNLWHVWHLNLELPRAREALDEIASYLLMAYEQAL